MKSKLIILTFVSFYFPGFKAGGPLRSIINLVSHLSADMEFWIVTRDHDLGDATSYLNINLDCWNVVDKAHVFYASDRTMSPLSIARLIRETPHDVLYVNSFFDFKFTGLPLLLRRLRMVPKKPCVIAPRGEFSAGAVALKPVQKRVYRTLSAFFGLYDNLYWQASSIFEAEDIHREFGTRAKKRFIAPDLPTLHEVSSQPNCNLIYRDPGVLRIIFLSRISPMKNLDYLLQLLKFVSLPLRLMICGPIENESYWALCQSLIASLPLNVSVVYFGEARPAEVNGILAAQDLLILPTRGENFGHVILEALTVGTPVLISKETPWLPDGEGGITTLDLADQESWVAEIMSWAMLDDASLLSRRKAAAKIAEGVLGNEDNLRKNKLLFERAFLDEAR